VASGLLPQTEPRSINNRITKSSSLADQVHHAVLCYIPLEVAVSGCHAAAEPQCQHQVTGIVHTDPIIVGNKHGLQKVIGFQIANLEIEIPEESESGLRFSGREFHLCRQDIGDFIEKKAGELLSHFHPKCGHRG
jgi:hypothetical protein